MPQKLCCVPGTPLIAEELAGQVNPEAEKLRLAAIDAFRWLTETGHSEFGRDVLVVDGSIPRDSAVASEGTFRGFGCDVVVRTGGSGATEYSDRGRDVAGKRTFKPHPPQRVSASLPTSLLVAGRLMRYTQAQTVLRLVAPDDPEVRWGERVLVVASGSTMIGPRAPGGINPDGGEVNEDFFDSVLDGHLHAMRDADEAPNVPDLCTRAVSVGIEVPAWLLVSRRCREAARSGSVRVDYRAAPFGVGYLIARVQNPGGVRLIDDGGRASE